MCAQLSSYSTKQLCAFIRKEIPSLSEDVILTISDQRIDGEVFVEMYDSDDCLKEVAPLVGDRLRLKKLIKTLKTQNDSASNNLLDVSLVYGGMSGSTSTPTPINTSPDHSYATSDFESSSGMCSMEVSRTVTVGDTDDDDDGNETSSTVLSDCQSQVVTDPKWAEKLEIPSRFSTSTHVALQSGIPTKNARDEIVNSLTTLILVHTIRPTPSDIVTVCNKLVTKYPCLKDGVCLGTDDCEYSSWKKKLCMKFRNLRRPTRASKALLTVPPPSKKIKSDVQRSETINSTEMEDYEFHIKHLKKSYMSQKWSFFTIMTLLSTTAKIRRKWISEKNPPVTEIIEKFPCFGEPKIILQEFCHMTGTDKETLEARWVETQDKVFKYAISCGNKTFKTLLSQFHEIDNPTEDNKSAYAILLIDGFLQTRGKGKSSVLMIYEGETLIIEDIIMTVPIKCPYVACFGCDRNNIVDIKLVIEKETILSMPSVRMAVFCCLACYYIYNIKYPPQFTSFFLFLETAVCNIKTSLKIPLSVTDFCNSLRKV